MITVVCLSPSLDRTIVLPSLEIGGTNRPLETSTVAGGKGVNVAMNLRRLGCDVRLAVFRYQQGSKLLFDTLDHTGIVVDAVDVPGTLRVNLKLLDRSSDTVTEINSSCEPVMEAALGRMEEAVIAAVKKSDWLILTGSMPRGCDSGMYARLIARAKQEAPACRIALDAEGEALRLGAEEKPDFIKPNRYELELLTGGRLDTDSTVAEAAGALVRRGVGAVLVSMGKDGCLLACGEEIIRAQAIDVPVVTTVGAGDAMLSGYLHAWDKGSREALRCAVAAAAARVAGEDGALDRYLPLVQMQ